MIVPPHAKDSNMNDGKPSKRPAPNRAHCPHKARFLAVLCPLNKQTILIRMMLLELIGQMVGRHEDHRSSALSIIMLPFAICTQSSGD